METLSAKAKYMLDNIIDFWKNLHDEEYGGFYGYMDFNLNVDKKAIKGCILNSRILWFFSEAAMLTGREDLKKEAKHAYNFLTQYCIDKQNKGVYWSLNYDGSVFDDTKHTYNQGFAIYALSSYYRLTKDEESLKLAKEIFELIENKCFDGIGYLESFDAEWKLIENDKLSENGVIADKTMNTLLHVFEGYSGLYLASSSNEVSEAMKKCLDIFTRYIYDEKNRRQKVFFDSNYNSIIDLYSYGHDIETSWLVDAGTKLLHDKYYEQKISTICLEMADSIYNNAYSNHSIANESENGIVDNTRVWWVQAEAVLGFINAYQKTNDEKYIIAANDVLGFIDNKIIDKRDGSEWFWCVDEKGNPIETEPIVEPWKCPYHNGRMCIEIIKRGI